MALDLIGKALEAVRSPKLAAIAAIVAAAILLIPAERLPTQWEVIRQENGWLVGLVLLISLATLTVELILILTKALKAKSTKREQKQMSTSWRDTRLGELDYSERIILREFVLQGRNTIKLPVENATVIGLLRARIRQVAAQPNSMCSAGIVAPVTLADNFREQLTNEVLGIPQRDASEEEWEQVDRERPFFIREIVQREQLWGR
jgi:hypothetical protein